MNSQDVLRRLVVIALLGLAYFLAASTSVLFTRFEGGTAFVWMASAIALGPLVVSEKRFWAERVAACVLVSFLATGLFSLGWGAGAALGLINLAEVVVAAALLRWLRPDFGSMRSVRETVYLIAIAGVVGPAASSFPGAGVITAVTDVGFWANWIAWISGHALGMIMFGPLVILAIRGDVWFWVKTARRSKLIEAAAILSIMAGVSLTVFSQGDYPLLFLPFPIMMIAVFRLGRIGAALSLLILFVVTVTMSVQGFGPIGALSEDDALRAVLVQLFLATASLTILPIASDLRDREYRFDEMRQQAALYRLILDSSSDAIIEFDEQGTIRFASPSTIEVLGIAPESLLGTTPHDLIHSDDIERVLKVHQKVYMDTSRTHAVDYRIRIKGREIGWFETRARATLDDQGVPTGTVCVIRNITSRKATEEELASAALTDPLTGIANRRAFEAELNTRLRDSRLAPPTALAMFDLDFFKQVNDTYGHASGDEVLRTFAKILRNELRSNDMPCRFGGEEFVALIYGDLDAARIVCERIRNRLEVTPVRTEGGRIITASVSVGVVALPPRADVQAVIDAGDRALYKAKRTGRNRVICEAA